MPTTEKIMSEAEAEHRGERMMDRLDREYLSTGMTRANYDSQIKQIKDWMWMRQYEARLARGSF